MKAEPAFPVATAYQTEGMSLRDYFAAVALNGMIANPVRYGYFDKLVDLDEANRAAERAYEFADAMLNAREPKERG